MGIFSRDSDPYPTPDALVALRNSRLWEAHAHRSPDIERGAAHRNAEQWSSTYQMLMTTAPGTLPVPLRRGDSEKRSTVGSVFYVLLILAIIAFFGFRIIQAF